MSDRTCAFDAVIALGSNIGDKLANMTKAIDLLTRNADISLVARSRDFKTPPWGNTDQDWFANGAITIRTALDARELLNRCQAVELEMGRTHIEKWGPRIIDLDILYFKGQDVRESDFIVPHPFLTERAFVLAPMADVAPFVVVKGKTIVAWLSQADSTGIEVFDDT